MLLDSENDGVRTQVGNTTENNIFCTVKRFLMYCYHRPFEFLNLIYVHRYGTVRTFFNSTTIYHPDNSDDGFCIIDKNTTLLLIFY